MSAQSSPSLLLGPPANQPEDKPMPKGHCRYILLVPELKGQRCACVSFTHNKGILGASCDCGHLACYHATDAEMPQEQKHDMEQLKRRIQALEAQVARGYQEEAFHGIVSRMSELEDNLEKSREDFADQIKATNRNIGIAYGEITRVDTVHAQTDKQLRQLYDMVNAQDVKFRNDDERLRKLEDRCMELQDADISLEDRLENLYDTLEQEEEGSFLWKRDRQPRRRSTSDISRPNIPLGRSSGACRHSQSLGTRTVTPSFGSSSSSSSITSSANRVPQSQAVELYRVSSRPTKSMVAWTVHISLLPHAAIPMPFERNTNAYQRCLSRGLHQVVAVAGPDAQSFLSAVNKAFGGLLKGRDWMPLQAKLCDARQLQGLPMLRQLEPQLINPDYYDAEFLRRHCAVCDANGTMESLYIAMRHHTLSWHALRQASIYMDGLEASWKHDALLDKDPYANDTAIDDCSRPAAGDLVTTFPPLKRGSSEISRSNSFSSSSSPLDADGSRVKRTCPAPPSKIVEIRRRGVETA